MESAAKSLLGLLPREDGLGVLMPLLPGPGVLSLLEAASWSLEEPRTHRILRGGVDSLGVLMLLLPGPGVLPDPGVLPMIEAASWSLDELRTHRILRGGTPRSQSMLQ